MRYIVGTGESLGACCWPWLVVLGGGKGGFLGDTWKRGDE